MRAQVCRLPSESPFEACALAIGNFDGVHIGHQALISTMVRWAKQNGVTPAVLTFDPHPAVVVAPDRVPPLICTLEERFRLLEEAGAERIAVLPFTAETARLEPEQFVSQILANMLSAKGVFVGENFRFGHKQAGTSATLRTLGGQYGFATHFVAPVTFRGEVVSSSAVRRSLAKCDVVLAGRLLKRCFSLAGPVVAGHGVGSRQTVPTLNIRPPLGQLVPRGVYVTETMELPSGRHWKSITNAGFRPTFGGDELTIETFLLDQLGGETPKEIRIDFRHFVRSERQFPTAEALKAQIIKDVARAQAYWRHVSGIRQVAKTG
jgi:riboflavin kinase/FMN adenylyltransferase